MQGFRLNAVETHEKQELGASPLAFNHTLLFDDNHFLSFK